MIEIDLLITQIDGLHREDLQRWIDNDWVRPGRQAGAYTFYEIDIERVRLIQQLCTEMQIDEDALPVILMLLDQLYDLRRSMRALGRRIEHSTAKETPRRLAWHMTAQSPE